MSEGNLSETGDARLSGAEGGSVIVGAVRLIGAFEGLGILAAVIAFARSLRALGRQGERMALLFEFAPSAWDLWHYVSMSVGLLAYATSVLFLASVASITLLRLRRIGKYATIGITAIYFAGFIASWLVFPWSIDLEEWGVVMARFLMTAVILSPRAKAVLS